MDERNLDEREAGELASALLRSITACDDRGMVRPYDFEVTDADGALMTATYDAEGQWRQVRLPDSNLILPYDLLISDAEGREYRTSITAEPVKVH